MPQKPSSSSKGRLERSATDRKEYLREKWKCDELLYSPGPTAGTRLARQGSGRAGRLAKHTHECWMRAIRTPPARPRRCAGRGGRREGPQGGSARAGSSLRTNPAAPRRACGDAAAAPALLKRGGRSLAAPRGDPAWGGK